MRRSAAPTPRLHRCPPKRRDRANQPWSWRDLQGRGDPGAAGKPIAVGAELKSQLFIVDPQIPVPPASHGARLHILHFLRDDADIGLAAAEIAETVVAETIG